MLEPAVTMQMYVKDGPEKVSHYSPSSLSCIKPREFCNDLSLYSNTDERKCLLLEVCTDFSMRDPNFDVTVTVRALRCGCNKCITIK